MCRPQAGLWLLPFLLCALSHQGHYCGLAVAFHTSLLFFYFYAFLTSFISPIYPILSLYPIFLSSLSIFCFCLYFLSLSPLLSLYCFIFFLTPILSFASVFPFPLLFVLLCQKCTWKPVLLPPLFSLQDSPPYYCCLDLPKAVLKNHPLFRADGGSPSFLS